LFTPAVDKGDAMPGLKLARDLWSEGAPPFIGINQCAADFDE
jgi:hypothetical protein